MSRTVSFLRFASALAVIVSLFSGVARSADWPQFRGPGGQGIAQGHDLPETWSESKNVRWKQAIDGKGWSSPVVGRKRIWVTTAVEHEATDAERKRLLAGLTEREQKQKRVVGRVELKVICLDWKSGKKVYERSVFEVREPDGIHLLNSYASPTPILEDDRLYCHFGTFGTICLNAQSGDTIWERSIPTQHSVGPGSSPVIQGDLLILTCDGTQDQFITALDKHSGTDVWRTDRPPIREPNGEQKKAFCTPLVIGTGDDAQVVIPGAQWFISYDPKTGDERWRVDHGRGFSNVPRPVAGDGLVYTITGFPRPELWAIKTSGLGDVSESHVAWKVSKQIPTKPSPLLSNGLIYIISDKGVGTCIDGKTGDIVWTERISGNYSASPVLADGKLYFCSHEGKTTVVRPGREYEELAQNHLDGQIMASPVVIGSSILIRTDQALYRLQNSGPQNAVLSP